MNETLTWEAIRREALALEIRVEQNDGQVFLYQCGSSQCGRYGESFIECEAAAVWLAEVRHAIEVRDHLRSMELPRRRRMLVRYLWRR